jgi:hypothetical protein
MSYARPKPIKNSRMVDTITATYNSKTCPASLTVKDIKITATQISSIVKKVDAYFM